MYKVINDSCVMRLSDSVFIPKDEGNSDYRRYVDWVDDGNTPEPCMPPAVRIPTLVSRFQARAALAAAGYFEAIDKFMAALPRTDIRRLAWEDATDFDRTSTTLAAMQQMLGLSDAQVDALFVAAAAIEA